jgi:hypothetical protein
MAGLDGEFTLFWGMITHRVDLVTARQGETHNKNRCG